jgi:guanine nucleotide-binding protein subunit alpha-12
MFSQITCNNCVCCLSTQERLQLEKSKMIDQEIETIKRRFRATQKIVLLGAGESGKSTFLKQMQIIHGSGFSNQDLIYYRTQVYENILRGVVGLTNGKRDLRLQWRGNMYNEEDQNVNIIEKMKNVLQNFSIVYRQLMDQRELEIKNSKKRIEITPEQFSNVIDLVIQIWNDNSIREAYDRRREFPKYFVENFAYFIEHIDRIKRTVSFVVFIFRLTTKTNES